MIVRRPVRRGAAVVEMAVVAPLVVLFLFGLIVTGLGVFRYNQTAYLAREAARYASVRGTDYALDTKQPAATADSVHQAVVLARAAGLTPSRLTTAVTWDKSNSPRNLALDGTVTTNYVTVTVSYVWRPEIPLLREMTLTSTSRVPMSQ